MRVLAVTLVLTLSLAGCFSSLTGGNDPEDYLTDKYSQWDIEIDYSPGMQPSSAVLNELTDTLEDVARKDKITTFMDDAELPSRATWTRSAIDQLNKDYQDHKTSGDTVVTHVMFVDGKYEKENVLGVAVGHDFIVIFSERIGTACASNLLCGPNDEIRVRKAVLIHEFGHIIGLVDNGIDMVRNHGDGTGHSTSENSVMYPSAETTGIFGLGTIPMDFDADDRADICAAGGKC